MKLSKARLAELKRLGYYADEQDTDKMVLTAVPKPREMSAAPEEKNHTSPKKWQFDVKRDSFGFIETIDATEIT